MNPGDVVLIDFPFDDLRQYKRRPVLVMACVDDVPDPDLIVLQITGSENRLNDPKAGDIITDDPALARRSVIRCRKAFTLRSSQVVRQLGTVDPDLYDRSKQELRTLLAM